MTVVSRDVATDDCDVRHHRQDLDLAQNGDYFAHDLCMGAIDGGVCRIVRDEPHVAVLLAEGFYGGFVIEQRRDYVPVFGVSLLAYHHEIAVADGCVHHGIPVDFEHEEITRAGEPFREPHDIFDVLLAVIGVPAAILPTRGTSRDSKMDS